MQAQTIVRPLNRWDDEVHAVIEARQRMKQGIQVIAIGMTTPPAPYDYYTGWAAILAAHYD